MTEEEPRARLARYRDEAARLGGERDAAVRTAKAAGMNVRQIGMESGLTRKTVYRILGLTPDEDQQA